MESLSKSIWLNWVFFLHIVFILANLAMLNLINPAIQGTSDISQVVQLFSHQQYCQFFICLYKTRIITSHQPKQCTNSSWKWNQKNIYHTFASNWIPAQRGHDPCTNKTHKIITMVTRWFVSQGSNLQIRSVHPTSPKNIPKFIILWERKKHHQKHIIVNVGVLFPLPRFSHHFCLLVGANHHHRVGNPFSRHLTISSCWSFSVASMMASWNSVAQSSSRWNNQIRNCSLAFFRQRGGEAWEMPQDVQQNCGLKVNEGCLYKTNLDVSLYDYKFKWQ